MTTGAKMTNDEEIHLLYVIEKMADKMLEYGTAIQRLETDVLTLQENISDLRYRNKALEMMILR